MKNFDESVHYTIKGRKRYKAKLWLVFGLLIIVLLCCAAMFWFANYHWNPDEGFSPSASPTEPYQKALLIVGAVLAIIAISSTFLYCWIDIGKFYRSQEIYFQSKKFKENKARALNGDISKLKKSTIKWYKKMHYLSTQEKNEILEKKKEKQKNNS